MIRFFSLFLILAALTATSYATPGSPFHVGPEAAIVEANGILLTAQEGPQPPPKRVIHLWVDPHYGSDSALSTGGVDIGADELSENPVGGYRFGTTSFINLTNARQNLPPQNVVTDMDNKYLWFFGPPTNIAPAPTNRPLRPWFRSIDHLSGAPANYTTGGATPPWFGSWSFGAGNYYVPSFADITPHLMPDFHPWHHTVPNQLSWPSWPVWQSCLNGNVLLYADPTEQIINPPGTYKGGNNIFQWLDLTWTVNTPPVSLIRTFGTNPVFRLDPMNVPTTKLDLDKYDEWRRGYDTSAPSDDRYDTFLSTFTGSNQTSYPALRYSLENFLRPPFSPSLTDTNLQSFMVIIE